jgi:hypothetical protein
VPIIVRMRLPPTPLVFALLRQVVLMLSANSRQLFKTDRIFLPQFHDKFIAILFIKRIFYQNHLQDKSLK